MRTVLTLTCCFVLALFAGAAQQQQDQDQGNPQGKKKGGGNATQRQVVTPQTGKVNKAGPGGGPHTKKNWQGPVTGQNQTNVSGNTQLQTHHNKNLPAGQ